LVRCPILEPCCFNMSFETTSVRTRIFFACQVTQLLVIQHLRLHLCAGDEKDFLVWHPFADDEFIDGSMKEIISVAKYAGVLDMRDFHSLKPRRRGGLWFLESPRRLRHDACLLRNWMTVHHIKEETTEIWVDDPIHFYAQLPRAFLRKARHIKYPHCFNHEDRMSLLTRSVLEGQYKDQRWAKRMLFSPWQRLTTGIDFRKSIASFDRAYTFFERSNWSSDSVDVSNLISLEAFEKTFESLPLSLRSEICSIETVLAKASRPLIILLLFGLTPSLRRAYKTSVSRIFSERSRELAGGTLAVKVHPARYGLEEKKLICWLQNNVPVNVVPITIGVNLELMLPRIRPTYVWAGPCGAMPIVQRLGIGRPIILPEIAAPLSDGNLQDLEKHEEFVRGMEVW